MTPWLEMLGDDHWQFIDWNNPVNQTHGLNVFAGRDSSGPTGEGLIYWMLPGGGMPVVEGAGTEDEKGLLRDYTKQQPGIQFHSFADVVYLTHQKGPAGWGPCLHFSADLSTYTQQYGVTVHNITSGDFCIEMFAKTHSKSGSSNYSGMWSNGSFTPALYWRTTSADEFGMYWGGERRSGTTLNLNQWYHLVAQRVGTTVSFYVDGAPAPTTHTISTSMSNQITRMGTSGNANNAPGPATYASCRFYNKSLSQAEITTLSDEAHKGYPNLLNHIQILQPRRPNKTHHSTEKRFIDVATTDYAQEESGYAGIALSATTSGSPDLIHTAIRSGDNFDEVWVYATNTNASDLAVTLQISDRDGANTKEVATVTIPSKSGMYLIYPGLVLDDGYKLEAYAPSNPSSINLFGFANRLDQST
jgi:hypothetical protein